MRLALFSDIHGNLEALQTALAEAASRGVDQIVNLGDVVGYGPDPGPCVDLVREHCAASLMGNHDEAVATGRSLSMLPKAGKAAVELHREWLSDDHLAWLQGLHYRMVGHDVTLAHAAPHKPELWPRLTSFGDLQLQFDAFDTPICFVGHSHRPAIVSDQIGVSRVRPGHRFLVDVGSIGQPRDHDPRLAFGIFDTEAFAYELVRAHYDVGLTSAKIRKSGLPEELASRLRRGY